MKKVSKFGRQGDVLFRKVKALPKDAVEETRAGDIVVAHSETGHNHVVKDPVARLFNTPDPLVSYLRLEGPATVDHLRDFHTHESLLLDGGGVWEVRRQREHTPEGWRRVAD